MNKLCTCRQRLLAFIPLLCRADVCLHTVLTLEFFKCMCVHVCAPLVPWSLRIRGHCFAKRDGRSPVRNQLVQLCV